MVTRRAQSGAAFGVSDALPLTTRGRARLVSAQLRAISRSRLRDAEGCDAYDVARDHQLSSQR